MHFFGNKGGKHEYLIKKRGTKRNDIASTQNLSLQNQWGPWGGQKRIKHSSSLATDARASLAIDARASLAIDARDVSNKERSQYCGLHRPKTTLDTFPGKAVVRLVKCEDKIM